MLALERAATVHSGRTKELEAKVSKLTAQHLNDKPRGKIEKE